MKTLYTSLAALTLMTTTAFAGNTLVPTPRPELIQPAALTSCERYLVPGTNYFNFPAGCKPAGNEKNDDEREGFGAFADIGQPSEDECEKDHSY